MNTGPVRLNKYIAQATHFSRRGADDIIGEGRVLINGKVAVAGQLVGTNDVVAVDGKQITIQENSQATTVMLNKPAGYVCSRKGQGNRTIYDLLPPELHKLNPVGRLDKDSSGLLLLTDDGQLANQLTHPRYQKTKIYQITLNKSLQPLHQQMVSDYGITLEDGPSKLQIEKIDDTSRNLLITMHEGRNRQIRRTFEALGYNITMLHRTAFGPYVLNSLPEGQLNYV